MKKKKNHQTDASRAAMNEIVVPDAVSVAMSELTAAMREGLLALAVGAGLQVMQVLMDESVTTLCGPNGAHDLDRTAVRHGREDGSVVLGGRQVPVRRPRVRTADRSAEGGCPELSTLGLPKRQRSRAGTPAYLEHGASSEPVRSRS